MQGEGLITAASGDDSPAVFFTAELWKSGIKRKLRTFHKETFEVFCFYFFVCVLVKHKKEATVTFYLIYLCRAGYSKVSIQFGSFDIHINNTWQTERAPPCCPSLL